MRPPLVAMLMGLPVVVFSVIVVMSPKLPARAMAVRFRPVLVVMGMLTRVLVLVPVLTTMGLLLALTVTVSVLMVFLHCHTSF
jgi:hypothetical protein